jgi:tetratricopeptide (TPR) repeat protein
MITATSASPEAIEHFRKGEALLDNLRFGEAAAEFDQALKLDPKFVLARALRGVANPSAEGLKDVDAAVAAAGQLPEPERLYIEASAAVRRLEFSRAKTALKQLTAVAPEDWRGHYLLGQQLFIEQQYADAVTALKKATALNPAAGAAQNALGYAALQQGDAAGAVAAFQEYARILPQEPNAQDSLGEALLASGRFEEAEAAFTKAVALSPQFWNAYQGIACVKAYAGDWTAAHAALAKARAAAATPPEKLQVDTTLVYVAMAQHNTKRALAILDGISKMAGMEPADLAFVPAYRATVFNDAGRYREALPPLAAALAEADSGRLPPAVARPLKGQALVERVTAEAGLRDVAAATRTSAALDAIVTTEAGNPFAASAMQYGRGMLAVAKGETAEARKHFDQCSSQDIMCKWQGLIAAEKAGDAQGAAAARAVLLKNYLRDPRHLILRSRISPAKAQSVG